MWWSQPLSYCDLAYRLAEVIQFMEEGEIAEHEQRSSALSLETMELQWKSYVSNLKASGTLSSALAVCDVSGSMSGEPMEVRWCSLLSQCAW